ncbi:hypothetical protein MK805_14490 [Shimazuella sp. AN120528]|uniref:hypothetical protein n=1 Tax=Shimazuella soli TaxID=1892854 RepID=UPI001F100B34|nr:hypothetical protein [Shimazuella soli]MCH5586147.1 hypothetical protein [Shimazuella soli]
MEPGEEVTCSVSVTTAAKKMSACGRWNLSRRSVTATPVSMTTPPQTNFPAGNTTPMCRGMTTTTSINPA